MRSARKSTEQIPHVFQIVIYFHTAAWQYRSSHTSACDPFKKMIKYLLRIRLRTTEYDTFQYEEVKTSFYFQPIYDHSFVL